jgi:hypothetical protein
VGFEITILVFEGEKIFHALDRAATVIDHIMYTNNKYYHPFKHKNEYFHRFSIIKIGFLYSETIDVQTII